MDDLMQPEALRYDFDGYGYRYIDSGSGSNWQTRHKDAEPMYTADQMREYVKKAVEAEYQRGFEDGYEQATTARLIL